MKKKLKTERLGGFCLYDLEGTLNNAISFLGKFIDDNPHYEDLELKVEGYEAQYFDIYGKRPETDGEMKKRLRKSKRDRIAAAKRKEKQKEQRRVAYEKLKREFENV